MSSFIFHPRTSLALAALAGCAASPNVRLDISRADVATTVELSVCPIGKTPFADAASCTLQSVFGATGLDRHVQLFVDDGSASISTFLDSKSAAANPVCLRIDLALGTEVDLAYAANDPTATCSPASACTIALDPTACGAP